MVQATFQTTVNQYSGFGVPGEFYNQGPFVASTNILVSGENSANNYFGRACSYAAPIGVGQNIVNVGNTGSQVYAGIISDPKSITLFGGLDPTLLIPDNTVIPVVSQGILTVFINNGPFNIGDVVAYSTTTGELYAYAPSTANLPSGQQNALATIYGFAESGESGYAVIWVNPTAPKIALFV